jgi:hypothetical protein
MGNNAISWKSLYASEENITSVFRVELVEQDTSLKEGGKPRFWSDILLGLFEPKRRLTFDRLHGGISQKISNHRYENT